MFSENITGNLRYFNIDIPAGCSKLRVVLVYPDPPAAAGASITLKNDLDLYCANRCARHSAGGQLVSNLAL
ncbi:MAG: hypothetical protein RMJ83_01270 [Armatimonadota bacterium]|nr:hypothetical protein [Armatimonadota bacterium]